MEEKRLDDWIREHKINLYSEEQAKKMTYSDKVRLFNEHPEEYDRLFRRHNTQKTRRPSGHTWSSQVRKE